LPQPVALLWLPKKPPFTKRDFFLQSPVQHKGGGTACQNPAFSGQPPDGLIRCFIYKPLRRDFLLPLRQPKSLLLGRRWAANAARMRGYCTVFAATNVHLMAQQDVPIAFSLLSSIKNRPPETR
jgi:hypothetical protein